MFAESSMPFFCLNFVSNIFKISANATLGFSTIIIEVFLFFISSIKSSFFPTIIADTSVVEIKSLNLLFSSKKVISFLDAFSSEAGLFIFMSSFIEEDIKPELPFLMKSIPV